MLTSPHFHPSHNTAIKAINSQTVAICRMFLLVDQPLYLDHCHHNIDNRLTSGPAPATYQQLEYFY